MPNASAHFRDSTVTIQLIKLIILVGLLSSVSCTNKSDKRLIGFWTIDSLDLNLTFYQDSVFIGGPIIRDKYPYSNDGLEITLTNRDISRPYIIWKYEISNDSLSIWYKTKTWSDRDTIELLIYTRSKADNYYEHSLTRNNLNIRLPAAANAREIYLHNSIDIQVGFNNDQIKIFIDNQEVPLNNVDNFLKDYLARRGPFEYLTVISCRLFIDSEIPCEISLGLIPYLRKYDLRNVYFMTSLDKPDPASEKFVGIGYLINSEVINIIETEKIR
ncbi:MAG: hypothetical protein EBR30_11710 [Cytophagia bacterium]|nr:hypothetical protein [Cytophagia bacterium]